MCTVSRCRLDPKTGAVLRRPGSTAPSAAETDGWAKPRAPVRIATAAQGQGAADLDSAVGPSGDRLAAASGSTYNWLLPDLHGSAAGSLSADQSTVTSGTRYDAWGGTIAALGMIT